MIPPKISLIIPVYNRESNIGYCIQSVLNQTLLPDEILISDDHSTDNTISVVKSFNNSRIKIITNLTNTGSQATRNRGIKASLHEWIAFLDSDDEWKPYTLETLVNKLQENSYKLFTVVHSEGEIYYEESQEARLLNLPSIEGENVYEKLLRASGTMFQGMLTSKPALEKIGYLDENTISHDEWETSLRLSQFCTFLFVKEPMFIYHWHKGTTISKNNLRNVTGYEYVVEKHYSEILKHCGKEAIADHYYALAWMSANYRLWELSTRYLKNIIAQPVREIYDLNLCAKLHIRPDFYTRLKPHLHLIIEMMFRARYKGFKNILLKDSP